MFKKNKFILIFTLLFLVINCLPAFATGEDIGDTTDTNGSTDTVESEKATDSDSTNEMPKDTTNENITILIDGKPINFKTQPIVIDSHVMVPMRTFFEALSTNVKWFGDTQEVIAYKKNMFIKLQINSNIAYKNGTPFHLSSSPIIQDSTTLVPIKFIAETFDMTTEWDNESNTVHLTSNNDTTKYILHENTFYKKVSLSDLGLSLFMPQHWTKMDDILNTYGSKYSSEFINVSTLDEIEANQTLDEIVSNYKNQLIQSVDHKKDIKFIGQNSLLINNEEARALYLINNSADEKYEQIIYFMIYQNKPYIFSCNYISTQNTEYMRDIFTKIMSTLTFDQVNVSLNQEHYIEYSGFFNYNVNLNSPISSNMVVDNSFVLSGTIEQPEGKEIESLNVIVSRNNDERSFSIPIQNNQFNSIIYTPFGIGKHNVLVNFVYKDNSTNLSEEEDILNAETTEVSNNTTPSDTQETTNEASTTSTTDDSETSSNVAEDTVSDETHTSSEDETSQPESIDDLNTTDAEETEDMDSATTEATDTDESPSDSGTTDVNDATDSEEENQKIDSIIKDLSNDMINNYDLSNALMQFSVINTSSEVIEYVIPSNYVLSNNSQFIDYNKLLTYKSLNSYKKAEILFEWILENITLDPTTLTEAKELKNSLEVFNSYKGTKEEILFLYTAMLRSIDIPARIIEAEDTNGYHLWVQVKINGQWIDSDIIGKLTENNAGTFYFKRDNEYMKETYPNQKILSY